MIFYMINYFLKNHNKCKHKKVTPFCTGKFCPDCGKKIKVAWVMTRCCCCNAKRHASVVFNNIKPREKYCTKCGSREYYIEKKEFIEYFDLEYSVISKTEVGEYAEVREVLQIWIENERKAGDIINNLRLIPLLAN